MKARVSPRAVIGGPLSETASRIGSAGIVGVEVEPLIGEQSQQASTPRVLEHHLTVAVSSTLTRVSIHLRDTMSTIAKQTRGIA